MGDVGEDDRDIFDFLPTIAGLTRSYYACYEILANLVRVASRFTESAPARASPGG
jgi:hypothetical protein